MRPRRFGEGDRAAAGQKAIWIDVVAQRQHGRRHRDLKDALGVRREEASHGARVGITRPGFDQLLQPGRFQPHPGVGGSDDRPLRSGDGEIAPAADVGARRIDHAQRGQAVSVAGGVGANRISRAVAAAAVADHYLVRAARLRGERVQQALDAGAFIEHCDDNGDIHAVIVPQEVHTPKWGIMSPACSGLTGGVARQDANLR
jgi:hypothetical protein